MTARPFFRRALVLPAGLIAALLAAAPARCEQIAKRASDEIIDRMRTHIQTLSRPEEEGRGPGSAGLEDAAAYIIEGYKAAGLAPGGDAGTWLQEFVPTESSIKIQVPPAGGRTWGTLVLRNVVGILAGSAGPDAPCLVIGAHYDHLGIAPGGSRYPGADDNASGIALLLELANRLRLEGPVRNTVVFVAFSGEEEGTLGSYHYTESPSCPLSSTLAMLNFDTVGRMEGKKLYIFGAGSAAEFHDILHGINMGQGLDLVTPDSAPFASDQIPFFEKGIPVLHFFSGPNADYHHPTDTEEKINYQGMLRILDFAQETAVYLADRKETLTFLPPGAGSAQMARPTGPARARTVSLGTIPDFSQETGGVLLEGTMPGSPAEKAGLQKGDVLVQLGGVDVDNLADLSSVLKEHQPGDTVEVAVKRDGEILRRTAVLVERK